MVTTNEDGEDVVKPGDSLHKVNDEKTYLAPRQMVLTVAGWKKPRDLAPGDVLFCANGKGYDQVPVERVYSVSAERFMMRPGYLDTPFVVAKIDPSAAERSLASLSAPGQGAGAAAGRRARSTSRTRARGNTRARSSSRDRLSSASPAPRRVAAGKGRRAVSTSRGRKGSIKPGLTTPLQAGMPPAGYAYLIRPPEGMCGHGSGMTPAWPAKVFRDDAGRFAVRWQCCADKGLACSAMVPSHHSNKTVMPLDCPIIAEVCAED